MTESSEILFCPKCQRRESFVISGCGTQLVRFSSVGKRLGSTPKATAPSYKSGQYICLRCLEKDCLAETLGSVSNGVDK